MSIRSFNIPNRNRVPSNAMKVNFGLHETLEDILRYAPAFAEVNYHIEVADDFGAQCGACYFWPVRGQETPTGWESAQAEIEAVQADIEAGNMLYPLWMN